MAERDERSRTRRLPGTGLDPRDDTGVASRSAPRPVSGGRARAARQAHSNDPLARLQELHPTTGGPAGPLVTAPLLPPAPDGGRARARRRGATSEVPVVAAAGAAPADASLAAAPDAAPADGARHVAAPDAALAAPDVADREQGAASESLPATRGLDLRDLLGSPDAEHASDRNGDRDHRSVSQPPAPPAAALPGALVLPVEREPAPEVPRMLLPTGRIPRVGEPTPGTVSDLPLQGIEAAPRPDAPATVFVPELDPSGEIVRDGLAASRPSLRDRLEPILVRRPRPRVRRVTRVLRHVDTWSVFKVALVFNLVVYVVCLTAGVLLWNVAYTTGTIDNVEQFFEQFGWEHFEFHGGEIYHHAWIAGLFATVGLTGFAVLLATLFNLITDLVGGIRLSVLEEEVVERAPRRRRTRVAREAAAAPAPAPAAPSPATEAAEPARPRRVRRRREATPATPEPALGDRPIDRATGEVPVIAPEA